MQCRVAPISPTIGLLCCTRLLGTCRHAYAKQRAPRRSEVSGSSIRGTALAAGRRNQGRRQRKGRAPRRRNVLPFFGPATDSIDWDVYLARSLSLYFSLFSEKKKRTVAHVAHTQIWQVVPRAFLGLPAANSDEVKFHRFGAARLRSNLRNSPIYPP